MAEFKNKVVWITGASSGIGKALAQQFAKEGSRLILSSRRIAELEKVKQICGADPADVLVLPLDLAKHDEMSNKVQIALDHFGQVDALINNGGISQRSLMIKTNFDVYKRLIDIDYLGTVALTKALLPTFVKQKSGHIAVVTSLMGKFASPLRSGYCGAKHALHGFFDSLRMEHEKDNVKVTIFCPGFIQTNVSVNALVEEGSAQQTMDDAIRAGMPAEVCAAKMLKGMKREKFEVLIGGKETIAVYIKRFFPLLLHRIIMRSAVT